jgi:hypothetical protein
MQGSKPCALPLGDTPKKLQILKKLPFVYKSFHPCDVLRILQMFWVDVNFESNNFL